MPLVALNTVYVLMNPQWMSLLGPLPGRQTHKFTAYSTVSPLTCPAGTSDFKGLEENSSLAWYKFLPVSYVPLSVNGFTMHPGAQARPCVIPVPVFLTFHIQNGSVSFHFISKIYPGSDYSWESPPLQAEAKRPSSFAWSAVTSSILVSLLPNWSHSNPSFTQQPEGFLQ